MSMYDTERVLLPQVKVAEWDQHRLYTFLDIFSRSYADFVRDLCDAVIMMRQDMHQQSFSTMTRTSTLTVFRRYMTTDYVLAQMREQRRGVPVAEQIGLHRYASKRIVRLPVVPISKWQAEHLMEFLRVFNRTYAEFVRDACGHVMLSCLDAQTGIASFNDYTRTIFEHTFDDMIEKEKMMGKPALVRQSDPPVQPSHHFQKER